MISKANTNHFAVDHEGNLILDSDAKEHFVFDHDRQMIFAPESNYYLGLNMQNEPTLFPEKEYVFTAQEFNWEFSKEIL